MSELALLGGRPLVAEPLPPRRSIGPAERQAVIEVMDSGCLSGFYGSWGDEFLGGSRVRALEEAWRTRFGVGHAVTVNSATSGLMAAMGAVGIGPGDEVIVPPTTMSATAVAPLVYGGVPVFADIEPETFCLDPAKAAALIGPRTKAIVAVNLFGHPARLAELRRLADERGLALVEDNAQGPLASEDGRFAGGVGHIGVFSLNYHKHIHAGEGGVCVTDDPGLALRLQLIRNHGENAAVEAGLTDLTNLYGFNFRLTELSAAVALTQLADAEPRVAARERVGRALTAAVADLAGVEPPVVRPGCRHVYYVWAAKLDQAVLGVSRRTFCQALAAEGVPVFEGYVNPLYRLPLFQRRVAMGSQGFPFGLSERRYEAGLCPVAEEMRDRRLIGFEPCMYDLDDDLLDRVAAAFRKVHAGRAELAAWERTGGAA